MALPSQMPRSGESVPHLNTGSSRMASGAGKLQIFGLIALGLVLIAVWWFWPHPNGSKAESSLDGVFEPSGAEQPAPKGASHQTKPEPAPTQTAQLPAQPTSAPNSSALQPGIG